MAMASQYGAFIIQFAASVILARWFISPEQLGLFTIAFAFIGLIAVLQEFGITRYIGGVPDLDEPHLRTAFSVSLTVSWGIAILCVALSWPLSRFYAMPGLLPLMLVVAASYFLVPLAIVPAALIQRRLDFRSNSFIEIGVVLANAVVAITLAWRGHGAMALAWGAFAQQAARALMAQWRSGWILPFPLRFEGAVPILRFGGGSTILSAIGQAGARVPDLLIGRLLDIAALGLFTRAVGLAGQMRGLVSGALAAVFYPAFARVRDRGEPLAPHYERVVASYCAITWPAMAGLAACSLPVITMLYGERWTAAANPLAWIAISQILFVALPLHVELPILLGRMPGLLWRTAIDNTISVALLLVGAAISLDAASASRVAYAVIWLAIHAPFMKSLVGFSWSAMLRNWAQSALVTGLAVLPVVLGYLFWAPAAQAGFVQMVVCAGTGVGLWLIGMRQCRHPAYDEVHQMSGSLLARFGCARLVPAPLWPRS
jgi:O-antigen/teichoic acid export membrane protein